MSLIDRTGQTSPLCRLCANDKESAEHLLLHCPALEEERNAIFRLEHDDQITDLPVRQLLQFLQRYAADFESSTTTLPASSIDTSST
jgi:hypothetical protein